MSRRKRCLECRADAVNGKPRCADCERRREQYRNDIERKARKQALYTPEHYKARRLWGDAIVAGHVVLCWRCSGRITSPYDLNLDHGSITDYGVSLPAHEYCNTADVGDHDKKARQK